MPAVVIAQGGEGRDQGWLQAQPLQAAALQTELVMAGGSGHFTEGGSIGPISCSTPYGSSWTKSDESLDPFNGLANQERVAVASTAGWASGTRPSTTSDAQDSISWASIAALAASGAS